MIERTRKFLVTLLLCLLMALPVWAENTQIGANQWVAGVPSDQFTHFAAPEGVGRQRMQNWCWAACIQMVLNWHGLYVSQEDIVQRVFGNTIDRPAVPKEMLSALSGWLPDTRGRYSAIAADPVNINNYSVVKDLSERWPLIVGLSGPGGTGHAYVMTAAYYYLNEANEPIIYRVVLRDPYPTQSSRIEMDMQQFGRRCTFATRVHVQRL